MKKDKFCSMILYSFISCCLYSTGSFISEWIFGYYSDYIGKYIIINILSFLFGIMQIVYFFLFSFILNLNSNDVSYLVWFIFAFFLGTCTTPLKNFIICYFLELYPNKDEIFSTNGFIQSSTAFTYLLNFIFFMVVKQIQWIFVLYFVLILIFLFIFKKYFRENPRFFSEVRNIFDEKLNNEYKKLAIMQILDLNKIQKPIQINNNTNRSENINLKSYDSVNFSRTKEDLIFNKDQIEKKIKLIKKEKAILNKRMNLRNSTWEKKKFNKCPYNFFNFLKKKDELDDSINNRVIKNTQINKKRGNITQNSINSKKKIIFNEKNYKKNYFKEDILLKSQNEFTKHTSNGYRRLGRLNKDINSNEFDNLTMDMLDFHYKNDLYVKKYILTYALVKLAFSLCFTSNDFYIQNKINDPNADTNYRQIDFILRIFFFSKLAHYIGGKIAFFVNSRTINMICLIIFGFIFIFIDVNLISAYTLKNLYYGEEETYFRTTTRSLLRYFCIVTISIVNSLFDISIVSYPPTLYRGRVMMKINLISNLVPPLTYVGVFLIDTWAIYIGILALIILLLYFTRLNDKNLEILESRDEAYETLIKNYINKRFAKINIVDKVDIK